MGQSLNWRYLAGRSEDKKTRKRGQVWKKRGGGGKEQGQNERGVWQKGDSGDDAVWGGRKEGAGGQEKSIERQSYWGDIFSRSKYKELKVARKQ